MSRIATRVGAAIGIAVLIVLAASGASAAPPPQPGRGSGFLTDIHRSGREAGGRIPAAYFRGGMNVWVSPHARHPELVLRLTRYAVTQLRKYSVDVTDRGVAPQRAQHGRNGSLGRIEVIEQRHQTGGCRNHPDAPMPIALGFARSTTYPVAGVHEVTQSVVTLCPVLMRRDIREQRTTVLHEFGHALGLGHYPGRYRGQRQVMAEGVTAAAPSTYQQGDINGLRYLVYEQRRLERLGTLHGAAKHWQISGGSVRVAGWAITGRLQQPTGIYLTVDGRVIDTDRTGIIPRPSVARRYHTRYADLGFHLIAPASHGSHRYCLLIADYTEPKARQTVACKTLTAPPVHPLAFHASTQDTKRAAFSSNAAPTVVGGLIVVVALVVLVVRRRKVSSRTWRR